MLMGVSFWHKQQLLDHMECCSTTLVLMSVFILSNEITSANNEYELWTIVNMTKCLTQYCLS